MTITTQNEHFGSQLPCPQDIDILANAMNGIGWAQDGALTQQTPSPDMTLRLGPGLIAIPPAPTTVAFSGNLALAIAPLATSYMWRIDMISVTHAGTVVVTTGAEQNSPEPPQIPGVGGATPDVVLWFVLLPPGTTVLTNDCLMDKRCSLGGVTRSAIFAGGASGAPSRLPMYSGTNTLVNSNIIDTGADLSLTGVGLRVNTSAGSGTGGTFIVDGVGRITYYANSNPLDGQVLIGNTASSRFDKAALTAGSGISITNAAGAITIAATGSGTGDVVGPAASVDNEEVLYSGTTGKLIKRSSATGRPLLTAGVQSVGAINLASEVTGDLPLSSLAQASAASRILGRGSASGGGDFQELTLGSNLTMSGTVLSAAGGTPFASQAGTYNTDSTERNMLSFTVPGGTLGTDGGYLWFLSGTILFNSGTPTWTLRVKLGATTLMGDASATVAANTTRRGIQLWGMLTNVGSASVQRALLDGYMGQLTAGSIAGVMDMAAANTVTNALIVGYGTGAEDTTTDKTFTISSQFTVSNVAVDIVWRGVAYLI